jgi:spore maturation protein A
MLAVSVLYGAWSGNMDAVLAAVMDGACASVELCLSIAGAVCLWTGFMELMRQCSLMDVLSRRLSPLLRLIFPRAFRDEDCARALSANFSANLLGLGNAATPAGIRAVQGMAELSGCEDELCRLVVMNTASVQLLPTTVAAVRAAAGCGNAFEILPCVWLSSLVSVTVGLLVERALGRICK